jgi:hypothetical protein
MLGNIFSNFFKPQRIGQAIGNVGRKLFDVIGGVTNKGESLFNKITGIPLIGGLIEKTVGMPVRQAINIGKTISSTGRRIFQKPEPKIADPMTRYPSLD